MGEKILEHKAKEGWPCQREVRKVHQGKEEIWVSCRTLLPLSADETEGLQVLVNKELLLQTHHQG